jgi:proteasome maturation protein
MDSLRRVYGLAEPIRRGMELGIVRAGDGIRLGGVEAWGVHEDILRGRDAAFGWEEVFRGLWLFIFFFWGGGVGVGVLRSGK